MKFKTLRFHIFCVMLQLKKYFFMEIQTYFIHPHPHLISSSAALLESLASQNLKDILSFEFRCENTNQFKFFGALKNNGKVNSVSVFIIILFFMALSNSSNWSCINS